MKKYIVIACLIAGSTTLPIGHKEKLLQQRLEERAIYGMKGRPGVKTYTQPVFPPTPAQIAAQEKAAKEQLLKVKAARGIKGASGVKTYTQPNFEKTHRQVMAEAQQQKEAAKQKVLARKLKKANYPEAGWMARGNVSGVKTHRLPGYERPAQPAPVAYSTPWYLGGAWTDSALNWWNKK